MLKEIIFLLRKRWSSEFNLEDQTSSKWMNRSKEAVSFFDSLGFKKKQKVKIADLGCGDMKIKDMLFSSGYNNISYKGFDCLPQSKTVNNINLNKDEIAGNYDVIFCLGLLEYLDDPYDFLKKLKNKATYVICSYVISDCRNYSEKEKKEKGWKNNFSSDEIEKNLVHLEFKIERIITFDKGVTNLYLLKT